jgi:integrase
MRAHLEEVSLDREEIYKLLEDAKNALHPKVDENKKNKDPVKELKTIRAASIDSKVSPKAHLQYTDVAKRFFGVDQKTKLFILPDDSQLIINQIKAAKTISTLRKYARSIRHISMRELQILKKQADEAQRVGKWDVVESIVSSKNFGALLKLSQMLPFHYQENWMASKKRKSKKTSLSKLPIYWRELMVQESTGKFKIPMMVALMTGARPDEFEKGIQLKLVQGSLYVKIQGAKVKEDAGQEYRIFKLADHDITDELTKLFVHVNKGNSLTTHMRKVGEKLWPRRKESITCYTARHSMAAHCKEAIFKGADPDLVSQVLGHIVDKTASYYGNRFQSGGASVVPSDVQVPKPIKHISAQRNANRTLPSQKNKVKNTFKP